MSEYWKSTPKYWCKHCKTFVRDTKLERTNHEATPKHQGNIKRFIRDLNRGNEREERDKQRAKSEVERLNGVVSGNPTAASGSIDPPWKRKSAMPPSSSSLRQATPAERKAQLAQLAAMGVAVPEDFRREMAMAGDWQTLSETPVYEDVKKEEDTKDIKPSVMDGNAVSLNIGIRKRRLEGDEEEEEATSKRAVRKIWGSTTKSYPGSNEDIDLDALLNSTKSLESANAGQGADEGSASLPERRNDSSIVNNHTGGKDGALQTSPSIKREESGPDEVVADQGPLADNQHVTVKHEDGEVAGGIIFKKRKTKPIRGK